MKLELKERDREIKRGFIWKLKKQIEIEKFKMEARDRDAESPRKTERETE